jgi:hypothetical protein
VHIPDEVKMEKRLNSQLPKEWQRIKDPESEQKKKKMKLSDANFTTSSMFCSSIIVS